MVIIFIFIQLGLLYFLILSIIEKNIKVTIKLGIVLVLSIAIEIFAYVFMNSLLQTFG